MFSSITNDLIVLFDPWMGSPQVLPLLVRVDLRVTKWYTTFPENAELEPHHQVV